MATIYQFRNYFWAKTRIDPETTARALKALQETGDLTATSVVEAAHAMESPLHAAFEWDDTIAGHEYRLSQARGLIRAIVTQESQSEQSIYVHVPDRKHNEGKYVPLAILSQNEDEYERALAAAQKFLEAAKARFAELRQIAEARGGKVEALAIAAQGFVAVHEALELLKVS